MPSCVLESSSVMELAAYSKSASSERMQLTFRGIRMGSRVQFVLLIRQPQPTIGVEYLARQAGKELLEHTSAINSGSTLGADKQG